LLPTFLIINQSMAFKQPLPPVHQIQRYLARNSSQQTALLAIKQTDKDNPDNFLLLPDRNLCSATLAIA